VILQSVISKRRAKWIGATGSNLVLDVGANAGQYAGEIRGHGFGGRIVSFEPVSAAFALLSSAAANDPAWTALNLGLGSEPHTATINISANNSESSSLLPIAPRLLEAFPAATYVATETIKVVTLDSLFSELIPTESVVWMKLDVQGYETQVLEGASKTLQRCAGLEVELTVEGPYEGQELMPDVIARLSLAGFNLVALEEVFVESPSGRVMQYNGIFERRRPIRTDFAGKPEGVVGGSQGTQG
jgi:FkbM family methyltransferase